MLEITTDPHAPGSGIGARRKNGDKIFLRGETIHQLRTVRKLLMKLAHHYNLPLVAFADFAGIEESNAENTDLIECLSTVPDPYAGVDRRVAMEAWQRDWRICNRILQQDPIIDQLLAVSGNQQDWMTWWRCNHPDAGMRSLLAEEIANAQELIMSNRARLAQRRSEADA
jgi:hypothetical protein